MKEILRDRTDLHLQERLAEVAASTSDAADLHMKKYRLTRDGHEGPPDLSVYDRGKPWPEKEEYAPLDVRAHEESWDDMMRLQSDAGTKFFSIQRTWLLARSNFLR